MVSQWSNPKPVWVMAIVIIGCMVLVGASFLLPLFTVESDKDGHYTRVDYYNDHRFFLNTSSEYEQNYDYSTKSSPDKELLAAGETTRNLRIVTLLVMLVLVLAMALSALGKIGRLPPIALFLVGLVSVSSCFIYMMLKYPALVLKDLGINDKTLFGSQGHLAWGMGFAWFILIFATVVLVACGIGFSIYLWREKKSEEEEEDLGY